MEYLQNEQNTLLRWNEIPHLELDHLWWVTIYDNFDGCVTIMMGAIRLSESCPCLSVPTLVLVGKWKVYPNLYICMLAIDNIFQVQVNFVIQKHQESNQA